MTMSERSRSWLRAIKLYRECDGRTLMKDFSFSVSPGDWVQIAGGNGAGKTTLLRLLAGLARADAGEIYWQGQPLHRVRDGYQQNLLWIGHKPGIKARLTALENLRFLYQHDNIAQCREALEQAGLAGYDDTPVNQLSAGQQQRVALSRLWLTRARLWILDEPFTAVDTAGVERLIQRMAQHTEQGGIVIFTTHQPITAASGRIRRIALSGEGTER